MLILPEGVITETLLVPIWTARAAPACLAEMAPETPDPLAAMPAFTPPLDAEAATPDLPPVSVALLDPNFAEADTPELPAETDTVVPTPDKEAETPFFEADIVNPPRENR